MPPLFTKPLDQLNDDDVNDIVGWPESTTVEFKETLPGRDGRNDPWLAGRDFDRFARDKLFREVVAFANTAGGHLVLGIAETDQAPPTAVRISPIPRCEELAERLTRSASQAIDPPIPTLLIRGVRLQDDGAGVVVFRVPASINAPHRAPDRECYIRRDASSVPMTMREIQDMVLNSVRRTDWVESRFSKASAAFDQWFRVTPGHDGGISGCRITAIPVTARFDLGRIYRRPGLVVSRQRHRARIDGQERDLVAIRPPGAERPLVRGARRTYDGTDGTYLDIYSDGCVEFGLRVHVEPGRRDGFYPGWMLAHGINTMLTIDAIRSAAGVPDTEYAIEPEISFARLDASGVQVLGFDDRVDPVLGHLTQPTTLPRLALGPAAEIGNVLGQMLTDIRDAVGARFDNPAVVEITEARA